MKSIPFARGVLAAALAAVCGLASASSVYPDFTVDTSGMQSDAGMSELSTYSRTGTSLNAQYKIDDDTTDRSSESNTLDNAIPGVRLTLSGTTASPVAKFPWGVSISR